MTQDKIDSIRGRMCDTFCSVPHNIKSPEIMSAVCDNACPLNELEVE